MGEIDRFWRDVETTDRGRMGDDHLDDADIDAEGDWARILTRARLVVLNELPPVQVPDALLAEVTLQGGERRGFAAPVRFLTTRMSAILRSMKSSKVWRRGGRPAGRRPS